MSSPGASWGRGPVGTQPPRSRRRIPRPASLLNAAIGELPEEQPDALIQPRLLGDRPQTGMDGTYPDARPLCQMDEKWRA
jgi:hypothetical protein